MAICNTLIDPSCSGLQTSNPIAYTNSLIQLIFTIFMVVGVAYFVWYFIMGGFHYIQSEGDAKKAQEARDALTHAFIGIVIIFSVYALLKLIGMIFHIDALNSLQLPLPIL